MSALSTMVLCVVLISLHETGDQRSRSSCVNAVTSTLADTTICLSDSTTAAIVVVHELFCSTCLTDLDRELRSRHANNLQYRIVVVGSDSRYTVNQRLPRFRRLVEEPEKLLFVSVAQYERSAIATGRKSSPALMLIGPGQVLQLAYEDLFKEYSPQDIRLDTGLVRRTIRRLLNP